MAHLVRGGGFKWRFAVLSPVLFLENILSSLKLVTVRSKITGSFLVLLFLVSLILYLHYGKQISERFTSDNVTETGSGIAVKAEHLTPALAGEFLFAGEPKPTTYPNSLKILRNLAFLVAYDETRHNPAWVAYRITASRLTDKFPRPSRFSPDNRLSVRVNHDDFTRSGFDRGHMAPNHAIASRFGAEAQRETFLMSNVVPQKADLNQGPWRLLEEALAERAAVNFGEVWVIVGPIYDEKEERLKTGPEIPDAFFCVVADVTTEGPRLQGFILPQDTPRSGNFRDYVRTVDAAEVAAGLDFFWELQDEIEAKLEAEAGEWVR